MIIVYTGNGKGKTTAALGLALRAVGWGGQVLIVQFLKKQVSGEIRAISKCQMSNVKCQIDVQQFGTKDFVDPKKLRPVDFEEARKAWESIKYNVSSISKAFLRIKYDLIILDEINVAVKFGLIKKEEVLNLLRQKPKDLTLVLTGRWADPEIIKAADLVTEFKEIKHPFNKAIKAIKGIDY